MESQWRKEFQDNGFIGPFKVYEPEEAKQMIASVRKQNFNRDNILFDNDLNYDRHYDIPELTNHIGHPRIVEKLRAIMGHDILCWRSEFFPKFPGTPGTEWHQVADYSYASGTPQISPIENHPDLPMDITVWTTFTEATVENGCLRFMPGSHKKKLYDESKTTQSGRNEEYVAVEADTQFYGYNFQDFRVDERWDPEKEKTVSMVMQPGECVIFTAKCCHASHPNITKRNTRMAIASRYVPTFMRVYPGQSSFFSHGANMELDNYGAVLVSGEDRYKHNTLRDTNNLGKAFPVFGK
ncbi:chlorinating enzyme [Pseudoalteromonas luteoviolacea]|uniref:chlorinating enzyme n=1 Tax=Pseudoalteromonas luteoviolacea TaxID=43657 RepID=UPI001F470222|nr:chlorinating enzyme [Pseudoalteromonas luteoviolacea]MCF6437903.1 chlorinating enzyme [Pseudoalteromonas luteoviolacea]